MVPLAIVAARLIYAAVWVALATIAFWIVDAIEVVNAFTYGGSFLSAVPDRRSSRAGCAASSSSSSRSRSSPTLPALYILDKPDELGLPDGAAATPRRSSPSLAVLVARPRLARTPSATTGVPAVSR